MAIYIAYIVLLFFFRYNLRCISDEAMYYKKEKSYLYWAAGILLLLTTFRGAGVGTDTRNYLSLYYYTIPSSNQVGYFFSSAPANFYLWKALSLIGLPHHFLLFIIEFVYVSAIVRFINKFSRDKIISFLLFFIFGLYSFSVPAFKQCVAMGLVLHAFLDFIEKKYPRSAILVILAFLFHKSSLVFVGAGLMYIIRKKKSLPSITIFIGFLLVISAVSVLGSVTNALGDEHYIGYLAESGTINWVSFIYYFILLLLSLIAFRDYRDNRYDECVIMYEMAITACVLQGMAYSVGETFRLAMYYLPAYIIIVPNISVYSQRNAWLKTVLVILMLFFYLYTSRNGGNIIPYKFIWQDNVIPYIKIGG